jgi:hypothetical protein
MIIHRPASHALHDGASPLLEHQRGFRGSCSNQISEQRTMIGHKVIASSKVKSADKFKFAGQTWDALNLVRLRNAYCPTLGMLLQRRKGVGSRRQRPPSTPASIKVADNKRRRQCA